MVDVLKNPSPNVSVYPSRIEALIEFRYSNGPDLDKMPTITVMAPYKKFDINKEWGQLPTCSPYEDIIALFTAACDALMKICDGEVHKKWKKALLAVQFESKTFDNAAEAFVYGCNVRNKTLTS